MRTGKSIALAIFFLFLAGGAMEVSAQQLGPPVVLHIQQELTSGNSIKIGYQIPYDGYIEFDLFNPEGERIWYTAYVREKGDHYQALRKDKLEANETYTYDFRYKGKTYSGKFTNN